MGGCASKPKAQDGSTPAALPAESPAAPDQTVRSVDGDAPAEAKTEIVEESKEEPLVDLSEPKPKESAAAAAAAAGHEELAPGIGELKAEAPVESAEPKEEEKVVENEVAENEAAERPLESSH